MRDFDQIYFRVVELGSIINNLLDVNPRIVINVINMDEPATGMCIVTYQQKWMHIMFNIPENVKYDRSTQILMDIMICHEYSHYVEDLTLSPLERRQSADDYNEDSQKRILNERKTWRRTKELAIQLGLWNRPFYNMMKKCPHVTDIGY